MPNRNQAQTQPKTTKRSTKAKESSAAKPAPEKEASACETQGESSEACIDERIKALENKNEAEERAQDRTEEQSQAQEQIRPDLKIGNAILGEEIPG